MGKTLLIGPAGCGKTYRVLEAFRQSLSRSDPLRPDLFFVVPSMEHTERIISLLVQKGTSGFFHKRVTTLSRLSQSIFMAGDIPVASSLTRAMIVKELLRKTQWEYFAETRSQPGLVSLLLEFLSELKEALIPPELFRERMNALKSFEPAQALKYEALAGLYENYQSELQERHLRDPQDALMLFMRNKKEKKNPPVLFREIWLDGFFDFSNLQLAYIRELSRLAKDVTITLTAPSRSAQQTCFGVVAQTQKKLESLGFQIEKMGSACFRTRNPTLIFLQKNLFSEKSSEKHPDPGEAVVFLDAVGIEGEIELIARQIHKLYRTGRYRYSDFAILFRQIKNYGPLIASIFMRYQIPVEIHERDRLKFSPWIRAVVSLLSLFRDQWKREDLFEFLRSSYVRKLGDCAKKEEWITEFEQRSFEEGISKSREAWIKPWKLTDRKKKEALDFNRKKQQILGPFLDLEEKLEKARTIQEALRIFREAVYKTFGLLEIGEDYTFFVRRDAASAARFEALLHEMERHFLKKGAPQFSFHGFMDHFLGLVDLDLYSLHERDKNRVQIYDVSLARQKEYKVVFIAGLLEKVFPVQIQEDPLLSDWERRLVNGGLADPLGERLPRQQIERLLFYLAITRASEKIFLSYPHLDIEGKESLPSFYLDEVQNLFVKKIKLIKQTLSRPYPSPEEAITARELETAVVGILAHEEADLGNVLISLGQLLQDAQTSSRIRNALKPIEAKITDPKIWAGGFFKITESSPTRIEEYAKCPYRYFAHRILKLQDPLEDVNIKQKGTILHAVLQRFFERKSDPQSRSKKGSLEGFIRRELKKELKKNPLRGEEKYRHELDERELYEMLFHFLEQESEQLEQTEFHPKYLEYSFGSGEENDSPALEVMDGSQKIKIQGRIDRIDTDPGQTCAVVVDYKRSANFERKDVELGVALQLPLYLLAVEKNLGLKPLGGEFYSIKKCERKGFYSEVYTKEFSVNRSASSQLSEEKFREILNKALEYLKRFKKEIEASTIAVKPRKHEEFCPYACVCRIERSKLPMIREEIKKKDAAQTVKA